MISIAVDAYSIGFQWVFSGSSDKLYDPLFNITATDGAVTKSKVIPAWASVSLIEGLVSKTEYITSTQLRYHSYGYSYYVI